MSEMPTTVTATYTKTITYDVQQIIESHAQMGNTGLSREEVFDLIYEYASEDLGCGWGHLVNLDDIDFTVSETDNNGE
jgi:hypothetical protein